MISKDLYHELKAYYDYQRLVEYNREKVWVDATELADEGNSADEIFEIMWNTIDSEVFETPPKWWVPKNIDYRIEGEIYEHRTVTGFHSF